MLINIGIVFLLSYIVQKNSEGKVYLIGLETSGYWNNSEAQIYIGIRDYNNDTMIVNFYFLCVVYFYQYGTTVETTREFSISKIKKIDGYLKIDKSLIGTLADIDSNNSVVLISDEKEKPFANLDRIIKGFDKYIEIKENDTIFITEPSYPGIEKRTAVIMDEIAML